MEREPIDTEEMLQGQAEILKFMFNFVDSMALKCAVELRIADTIHSYGCPITLSKIISSIGSSSPDITCLARIMRLLVRRKIFTANHGSDGVEAVYGLTHSSRWLLRDAEVSLAPIILLQNDERMVAPLHHLSGCLKEGGIAFEKAHHREMWDYASLNPDFNMVFNDGMECTAKVTLKAVLAGNKDGFSCLGSVVDVGGGTGAAMAAIVKAHPHIRGINFDLPHVIVTAPNYSGVSHVGGDMFKTIPNADAVFMKSILHDWGDKDCIKILRNCRKSIPEKSGKVIIVDILLNPEGDSLFDDTGLVFDLLMLAYTSGGKERTELEWKKLLNEAGFSRYRTIKIAALASIIEAYPE